MTKVPKVLQCLQLNLSASNNKNSLVLKIVSRFDGMIEFTIHFHPMFQVGRIYGLHMELSMPQDEISLHNVMISTTCTFHHSSSRSIS